MFLSYWYRISWLQYTNVCLTLWAAYVCIFYLQNYWYTLHLWVHHLMCRLSWLALSSESLRYTLLTYCNLLYPTLSAAYVC